MTRLLRSPVLSAVSGSQGPAVSLLRNLVRAQGRLNATTRFLERVGLKETKLVGFGYMISTAEAGCFVNPITGVLRDLAGVSSSRGLVYGFRTFCTMEDLSAKKCVPCSSKDLQPMTEQNASDLLKKVSGWDLLNENGTLKLQRSWKVKSFTKGLDFFKLVADIAEAEGHHPDLHLVGWNNLRIEIWTHAVGGLTENDFILAAKINKLDLHDLLRRKKVGGS